MCKHLAEFPRIHLGFPLYAFWTLPARSGRSWCGYQQERAVRVELTFVTTGRLLPMILART
jgi:hypothetical protein